MTKIFHILKKEFLVIGRDVHAVAVLFVMPAAFILIMSLAMQDLFAIHTPVRIDLLTVDQDGGPAASALLEALGHEEALRLHRLDARTEAGQISEQMMKKDFKFAIILTNRFSAYAENREKRGQPEPLLLLVNPTAGTHTQMVMKNILAGQMAGIRGRNFVRHHEQWLKLAGIDKEKLLERPERQIGVQYVYRSGQTLKIPTAVQQSVPAWLVFSMFFIVIPISNTFITERAQGTLTRLKSMNVPGFYLLAGKMVPYFLINLAQAALMILIGRFIVPLLGGTALALGQSWSALLLITAGVSFCAISLALFIASISRTTEQATTIGGVLNIILGAIGGIMIPKFVMPDFMQRLAGLSPMSWGLDGFLDVFLRNGGVADVWPKAAALIGLGAVSLILTSIMLKRKQAL
jgi:ABC-2 type transport system permease protein